MPFDKWFRQESDAAEQLEEMFAEQLHEEIVLLRQEHEVYETPAWEKVDEILAEKLERSFRDMMVGDPDAMILARERARVVSDLRAEPQKLREKIADRIAQLKELEGEEVEGETDG